MAYLGSQLYEFGAGVDHLANAGHANENSVTLGSLQAASDRWSAESAAAAITPHSVLPPYSFSRSTNGSDGQNFLQNGVYLGSSNGMAAEDFDKNLALRYAGGGSNDNLQ